jgi:hypothetical protein
MALKPDSENVLLSFIASDFPTLLLPTNKDCEKHNHQSNALVVSVRGSIVVIQRRKHI